MTGAANVHLVGAMLFPTGEDTMRSVAESLGAAAEWIPDGETGERSMWLTQHQPRFASTPGLARKTYTEPGSKLVSDRVYHGLAEGASPEDVELPTLGYAGWAQASFAVFDQLQREGVVAAGTRFQQAIPTPLAFVSSFIHPDEQHVLEPVIERAIENDIRAMCEAIPHDRLAIQWDVALEFGILEGVFPHTLADPHADVVERLVWCGNAVPADVHLAYHLCYGAPYDIHMVEPSDARLMTQVANEVLGRVGRTVQRLHLPVPIERDDRAFFAPLADLSLPPETRLFLGLVHHEDGEEGGRRRIAAAKLFVSDFGVATECGTSRTPADPVELLRLQAQVAAEAAQPPNGDVAVPDQQHATAPPPEVANARVREIAEQIDCPVCEASAGTPCALPGEGALPRPHYPRYLGALTATVMPAPRVGAG